MIRILTDSASDILPAEAEQLGVTVIPLNVTLEDGVVLRDGIDMTPSAYYDHLASCRKLPTTSQPSPELFETFYLEAAAAGDEVLGIFLSHELSGTWQCAKLAADLANVDNVLFVNSANVCLGEALLVRLAVQLRDAGKTLVQIATDLEHAKEHLHLVAAIDDLKYLRKGGRLPAAVAVAGGMLGIKPLITIMEGKVAMAGKARGLPGAYVALFKKIDELGGISPDFATVAGYSASLREVQPIQNYFRDTLDLPEPLVRQIGCVIGTHAGPGAFISSSGILRQRAGAGISGHRKKIIRPTAGPPLGSPTCFLQRETGANSLSQNLTVLPAPSGREPLARPALTALRPR